MPQNCAGTVLTGQANFAPAKVGLNLERREFGEIYSLITEDFSCARHCWKGLAQLPTAALVVGLKKPARISGLGSFRNTYLKTPQCRGARSSTSPQSVQRLAALFRKWTATRSGMLSSNLAESHSRNPDFC